MFEGIPQTVVLFSTVGGKTRFCFVFSRDRALGIGRNEFWDPWEYSIEIKRQHSISCPQERSEMTIVTITSNVSSLKWNLPSSSQTGSPS